MSEYTEELQARVAAQAATIRELVKLPDFVGDVVKLMEASGQGQDLSTSMLYSDLIREEYNELLDATTDSDDFDACLDLIWVVIGYMHARGWPIEAGWREVARSNHAKIVGGQVLRRSDNKILKPAGWTPPNLACLLNVRDAGPTAYAGRAGNVDRDRV